MTVIASSNDTRPQGHRGEEGDIEYRLQMERWITQLHISLQTCPRAARLQFCNATRSSPYCPIICISTYLHV